MNSIPFLRRKIITGALLLTLVWLGRALYQVHGQRAIVQTQLDNLEEKVNDLEHENIFLASASAYFQSDAYLERQARLKLNYKMPDEAVAFIYKDTSIKEVPKDQQMKEKIAALPNWQKWWYYVLGY